MQARHTRGGGGEVPGSKDLKDLLVCASVIMAIDNNEARHYVVSNDLSAREAVYSVISARELEGALP